MEKEQGGIGEISRRMNLSKSTVSKALNNCGNVDASTKEAILRTARELQYTPARQRRLEKKAGEYTVGVVVPINPYYFWNEAVRGMKDAAAQRGDIRLTLSLFAQMTSETDALYCLDYMRDLEVDVLVVTPPPLPSVARKLRAIAEHTPVVAFNETADAPFLFYAGANFYQDGVRLARAARDALATHPGVLRIQGLDMPMVRQRDEGFCRETQALLPDIRWVGSVQAEKMPPSLLSAQLARILHGYGETFHALYVSQGILPQVCLALHKLGRDGDVAVCGYENPSGNDVYRRKGTLTAVIRQDIYRQGFRCIQAVGEWLAGGVLPDNRRVYVSSLLFDPNGDGKTC